jgi:DNA invertase Pin-like site-specific DNA recombinase
MYNPMTAQFFRDHFTLVTVSDKGTEARALFDDGETRAAIAAQMGVSRSTVEHLTRAPAPRLPTWTDDQLDRLPAHIRQMIEGGTNA